MNAVDSYKYLINLEKDPEQALTDLKHGLPIKSVLFHTEDSDHGPKPNRQYLGVLRMLSYPPKVGDKYIACFS